MAQAQGQFSPINVGESEVFGLNFALDLPTGDSISSVSSLVLTQAGGTGNDPNPSSRLDGGPSIIGGNTIAQRITGPVAAVVYKLNVYISTVQGNVLELWAYIPCVAQ